VNTRRSLRRGDDPDQQQPAALAPDRRDRPETASILDLQASAGNRAVAELITSQAEAGRLELQRDPAVDGSRAEPTNEGGANASGTMAIPDLDLSIPLLSFSQQLTGPGRSKEASGDVVVTLAIGKLDARLTKAVADGRGFKVITIVVGTQTITLRDVIFSSVNIGPDTATLGLNFTSMEHQAADSEPGSTDE
jgi:hypothetical protein